MRLASGAKLGTYEIISLLGTGGMGEVYRARDTRLGRDVAIKVLPADRLADEDRRRRFVQEAQAASALNHPHIITIHEIESANGHDFIVMEYVRGKSLDVLIPRQGMRLAEVLRIAIPVADAVVAAHARGIIHRDLKPANVIVGTDGAVKVLDFGLAKLTAHHADPEEQTVTHVVDPALSVPGTIAGTAAYMSPEQATGGKVGARSDIFAFGAMLYEMVTGTRAFPGGSTTETLNAVLRAEPKRPSAMVTGVPPDLEKVILRCLRKDPARRFQHIDDVNVALHEIKEESESGTALGVPRRRGRIRVTLVVAVAFVLMTGIAGWLLRRSGLTNAPPLQVLSLTSLPGHEVWPTFSPDGTHVAFEWDGEDSDNPDIYIKMVESSEVRRLTTNPGGDRAPRWSPDGRQIAYVRDGPESEGGRIHLVSPLGGSDLKLNDVPVSEPVAWSPDARYLAAQRVVAPTGIYLIPVHGDEPRPITTAKPSGFDFAPAFSKDGRWLAYASCARSGCDVYAVELGAAFTPTSSPRRLTSSGVPAIGALTWTRDGRSVVYSAQSAPYVTYLWRVGLQGNQPPERIEVAGPGAETPVTVPSGDRLAFARVVGDTDVYRFRPGRSSEPVVASTFPDTETRFSPDGRRLAFCSMRSGDQTDVWLAAADGSNAQQLTRVPGHSQGSPWWSPDGRRIAFDSFTNDGRFHIWIIDADGGTPHQLTHDPGDQTVPYWSRDGRWIYYSADQGTGQDIWRVLATGGRSEQVTRGGSGKFACESRDGKSLLYQPKNADSPLLMLPLSGGVPRQLVGCVKPTAFGTGPQGVYYVACDSSPDPALHVIEPETGRDRVLGRLEQYQNDGNALPLGLAVSPDGMSILYLRHMRDTTDLMLIENFR